MLSLGVAGCSGSTGVTESDAGSSSSSESETGSSGGETREMFEYLANNWGIRLSNFDVDEFDVDDDGRQTAFDDGTIEVEGLGSWEISLTTIVDPASLGGQTSIFVSNADLTEERYFLFDPVENYITIGDLTKGVALSKNPDSTYDVWAFDGDSMDTLTTVDNGFEALKLVEKYNEFTEISPFILLTAFAVAHGPVPEARMEVQAFSSNVAAATPVCDIFKEFCDCAACLVLEREGACDLCPDL